MVAQKTNHQTDEGRYKSTCIRKAVLSSTRLLPSSTVLQPASRPSPEGTSVDVSSTAARGSLAALVAVSSEPPAPPSLADKVFAASLDLKFPFVAPSPVVGSPILLVGVFLGTTPAATPTLLLISSMIAPLDLTLPSRVRPIGEDRSSGSMSSGQGSLERRGRGRVPMKGRKRLARVVWKEEGRRSWER
jgi:hypothetical protein